MTPVPTGPITSVSPNTGPKIHRMTTFRTAVDKDVDAVTAIVTQAFRVYLLRMDQPPAPMTADYQALVEAGQVRVAADENDELLGLLVLRPTADHLSVDTLAVRPSAQGAGIGQQLLTAAEDEAGRLGLPAVVLCTNEVMIENLAYYPRHGYQPTHRIEENGFRRVYFRKPVPAPETPAS